MLTNFYTLQPVTHDDIPQAWHHGRPPGIAPHQWPRSRVTGLPMAHLLTTRIPNPLPNHPFCAFALFQSEDFAHTPIPTVSDLFNGTPPDPLPDLPFWHALEAYIADPHPHEHHFTDARDAGFALIWLTNTDFHSLLCPLPSVAARLDDTPTTPGLDAYQHDAYPEPLKLVPQAQPLMPLNTGFHDHTFQLAQSFGGSHLDPAPLSINLLAYLKHDV